MKVMTIVGTRPEIIRLSCVIDELDAAVDHVLVNTNQNFDSALNEVFFSDLEIRKPDKHLSVAANTTARTIANVISETEIVMKEVEPDVVLILGDTNSAYGLLSAKKLGLYTVHVEAGNRSFDPRVPEELNRKVVDHISDLNVCYSDFAVNNLLREGLHPSSAIKLGSPLFEVFEKFQPKIDGSNILTRQNLHESGFVLLSLHRNENLCDLKVLKNIFTSLQDFCLEIDSPLIVSCHPALSQALARVDFVPHEIIRFCDPFDFSDYCRLQKAAKLVISDSGTIVEESAMLGISAVVLRANHERQEANGRISAIQCDPGNPDFSSLFRILVNAQKHGAYPIYPIDEYCNRHFSKQLLFNIVSGYERFKANKRLSL